MSLAAVKDETLKIRFAFEAEIIDSMTWEEYEVFERAQDGELKAYLLRPVMARFMVDDKGQSLDMGVAKKMLGRLKLTQISDVASKFAEAIQEKAVPKASGAPSGSDSAPDGAPPGAPS